MVLLDENKSAYEAAARMSEKRIGSVVVTRAARVVGLFTERDLLLLVLEEKGGAYPPDHEVRHELTRLAVTPSQLRTL